MQTLPKNKSKTIIFRRYNKLALATTPLVEGVTPTGSGMTKTDIQVTVKQYGDFITITDVIRDTHEDPVLMQAMDILGDQADETIDVLRGGVLKAGTNVLYANGVARNAVNTALAIAKVRTAIRLLKNQAAKKLKSIVNAGPNIGTTPIAAAYIGLCHSDIQPDLEAITGYTPVHKYADPMKAIPEEVGAIGEIRFVISNNMDPWEDAGGLINGKLSTTGVNADVYPVIILGMDAYGLVPLAGKNGVSTFVSNPKAAPGDPLAQRGTVGWKTWNATKILQDLWMLRIEVAATG
jgi:N4-gp56 family major capsid protein